MSEAASSIHLGRLTVRLTARLSRTSARTRLTNSPGAASTASNAEGDNRFYGTYHEVKILPDTLQDEQLRALTE